MQNPNFNGICAPKGAQKEEIMPNIIHEESASSVGSNTSHISAFENALKQFDSAAKVLNLNPNQVAVIREPRRVTEVNLPIRMDDGRIQIFKGYRVQHNICRGPAKGGGDARPVCVTTPHSDRSPRTSHPRI